MDAVFSEQPDRLRFADTLRHIAEAVFFAIVVLAPWAFACVEPGWLLALLGGVGLLSVLWFAHVLCTRELFFRWDVVSVSLLGLIVFTAFQTVPLPESMVGLISPTRLEYHRSFRPDVDERLPGEPAASPRPTRLPLSLDTSRTRDSLVSFVAVFLVYAAARNFVYTRSAAQRFAWLTFGNGVLLALIALLQFFSSPRTVVFWTYSTQGGVFGPFVCKNHYPYYLSICCGLGLTLLLQEWQRMDRESSAYASIRGGWADALHHTLARLQSPRSVLLLGGLGLMLVSIPFSLSRGGLLAFIAAGIATGLVAMVARSRHAAEEGDAKSPIGIGIVAVLIVGVLAVVTWLGWEPIRTRFETLGQGSGVATGERIPLWTDLSAAIGQFPLVGAGAGATIHLEVLTRERPDIPFMFYANAHNEYLEALIEGGIIRLALTLTIAGGLLWGSASGYLKFARRSQGPWLLGAFFGFAEIAIHSAYDFGIHIPAVAMIAAVAAGFAMAVRDELFSNPERRRGRVRKRVRRIEDAKAAVVNLEPIREPRRENGNGPAPTITGLPAAFVVSFAVLASGMVVSEAYRSWLVSRWGNAAVAAAVEFDDPERMKLAADRIENAARIRPDDPTLWNDLAAARLADALDRAGRTAAAVAGPAAYLLPLDTPPPQLIESHVVPALRAARTARNLCPVLPGPQLRLGAFADGFASHDPPEAYFERAKRASPADAEIRYLSGVNALAHGRREAAFADWRAALARSRSVLPWVLRATSKPLPPDGKTLSHEELRTQVLPDDPAFWVAAADLLFPSDTDSPERQTFLRAAHDRWTKGPPPTTAADWVLWGDVCEELQDWSAALRVWQQAVEAFPESEPVRDGLASRLEGDEQYDAALPHLLWLRDKTPGRLDIRDRLDALTHAQKLQREIAGK